MAYKLDALAATLALPEPYRCPTCPYCNGQRDPTPRHAKPSPWEFWKAIGEPKFVVAPMVDQSELPFRMFCRDHGATLAYTPMFHAGLFAAQEHYRKWQFSTCSADRPLFVQFCGHEADTVLAAARHVEDSCDAVDLNLGCPQGIARRGRYGSFLMEHWDIIHTILHTLSVELKIPVTAKMRLFDDEALTLRYARMLRDAGAHVIAVHGRTRIMKGAETGLADLNMIRKVKEHIKEVPVISNGNILAFDDAVNNLATTGCDGVMSAEGLLWDPRLFAHPERPVLTGRNFQCDRATRVDAIDAAILFVDRYVRTFPTDLGFTKAHIFKIVHHSLEVFPDMRGRFGDFDVKIVPIDTIVDFLRELKQRELTEGPEGAYVKRIKERGAARNTDDGDEEGSHDGSSGACGKRPCGDGAADDEPMDFSLFTIS